MWPNFHIMMNGTCFVCLWWAVRIWQHLCGVAFTFSTDILINRHTNQHTDFVHLGLPLVVILKISHHQTPGESSPCPWKYVFGSFPATNEPSQYLHTVLPWNKLHYYNCCFPLFLRFPSCLFLLCLIVSCHHLPVCLTVTHLLEQQSTSQYGAMKKQTV